MLEIIKKHNKKIDASKILSKLKLKKNNYFLVSLHREENVEISKNFNNLIKSIQFIENKYKMPIIISTHPRTKKKLSQKKVNIDNGNIIFTKPFGFIDYNKLQLNAYCVISDSGTITEESSIFDIPSVMIRQAHERPEGMENGVLIMSGLKKDDIEASINIVISQRNKNRVFELVGDYNINNFSRKFIRVLFSYVEYVNRVVWQK